MKTINPTSQREKIIFNYFCPHAALDLLDIYQWLSPEIVICTSGQLPGGRQYHGLNGVGDFIGKVTKKLSCEIQLEEIFSSGEQVIAIGRTKGRIYSTGRPFDYCLTQFFTFDPFNKIRKIELLTDSAAVRYSLKENQMKTTV